MQKSVEKLILYFQKKKIQFLPSDGDLNNVQFISSEKIVKISHHSFYRYSGIASIHKEIGENKIELISITDELYMENYMKPVIELLLNIKEK